MKIKMEEQLIKYGYISEQVPPFFNSLALFENYTNLLSVEEKKPCDCMGFTIPKNNETRRHIKIPNPSKQIQLFNYLLLNERELEKRFTDNEYSLSNPFYYSNAEYEDFTFFNLPLLRESKPNLIKSTFLPNLDKKMNESMGYKYCYRLDLANFYDSIYTHSIEWAIIGKEEAKKNIRLKIPNLGSELDKLVRATNSNETSGIPTGPFTSRIISELILTKVNSEIKSLSVENNVDFKFVHYVDDYEFYFRSESDIHKVKNKITGIFESYRLRINENKTSLIKYPYHSSKDLKSEFEKFIEKYEEKKDDHILRLLFFKADEFTSNGEKGAYKYLYKMLSNKIDLNKSWNIIEPFIIGHLLSQPSLSQHITDLILKYNNLISAEFKKELYNNLCLSLDNHLHNESQWLLWSLMKINYQFTSKDLVEMYIKCDDDLTKIMLIRQIYKLNKNTGVKLKALMVQEVEVLALLDFESERWLLMHEWYMNSWEGYKKFKTQYNKNKFFQAMKKYKVTFIAKNN